MHASPIRILVTGATGFVGQETCLHLSNMGHQVVALSRTPTNLFQDNPNIKVEVTGDLTRFNEWDRVLKDTTAIVNLCALVHQMSNSPTENDYLRVNTILPTTIAESAIQAGVKHFIFLSSVKAVGERTTPDSPMNLATPCNPLDAYGRSKREAELRLQAFSDRISTTIIRAPLIYGPQMRANMLRLFHLVNKELPLPFGSISNQRSLLFVRNLSSFIDYSLNHRESTNGIFHIADSVPLSTPHIIRNIGNALKKKTYLFPFPTMILPIAFSLLGKKAQIERLTESLEVDVKETCEKTGWQIPYSSQQGFAETANWFMAKRESSSNRYNPKSSPEERIIASA